MLSLCVYLFIFSSLCLGGIIPGTGNFREEDMIKEGGRVAGAWRVCPAAPVCTSWYAFGVFVGSRNSRSELLPAF